MTPGLETPASRTWDAGLDYRLNARWTFRVSTLRRDGRSSYRDVEFGAQYARGAAMDVEAT